MPTNSTQEPYTGLYKQPLWSKRCKIFQNVVGWYSNVWQGLYWWLHCLQCFDTDGWKSGWASGLKKNRVMRCWHGYLSTARCKWFAYGPADAVANQSSLASLKSRMVLPSAASLPRLSWKSGR